MVCEYGIGKLHIGQALVVIHMLYLQVLLMVAYIYQKHWHILILNQSATAGPTTSTGTPLETLYVKLNNEINVLLSLENISNLIS